MKPERLSFNFELRDSGDGSTRIVGHAAVFNQIADIGGMFREQVAPGAFRTAIQKDDVRALFNHDPNFVIGRNTAGTLRLSEDETGLAVEMDPPDTQWARDLVVSMKRGDITQMSFSFRAIEEKWDSKQNLRTLVSVNLFDVSPVTYPAYGGTDVSARSADEIFRTLAGDERPNLGAANYLRVVEAIGRY